MQDAFMTQVRQRSMAMDDLYLFADEDLSKNGKRRENGGEGCAAIYNPMRKMVDLESVGQVPHAGARRGIVGVSDDDDVVSAIDKFLEKCQNG